MVNRFRSRSRCAVVDLLFAVALRSLAVATSPAASYEATQIGDASRLRLLALKIIGRCLSILDLPFVSFIRFRSFCARPPIRQPLRRRRVEQRLHRRSDSGVEEQARCRRQVGDVYDD